MPERRVANGVARTALDEAVGFEVFEFGDGLMALESAAGGLPLREAEAVLRVAHDFLQHGDDGEGQVACFRRGEAAQDVGGDFDHGIEHAAAEVGEGDGPEEAEDDAGAPVFALAEEKAGAGADDAEVAGGDEPGVEALDEGFVNVALGVAVGFLDVGLRREAGVAEGRKGGFISATS